MGANPGCVATSVLKLLKFYLWPTQLGHTITNMELRTYLSFSQVMVASLVLIFSHSGYHWHLTTNRWHLAAPKNDEVFQIMFGKGFQMP